MRLRAFLILAPLLGLAAAVVVLSAQSPAAGSANTQQSPGPPPSGFRTPDGQPDLQGIWSFSNLTPMERPAQFAGKSKLTQEEAAEYERAAKERANQGRAIELAYDASVWREAGNMSTRTSLIIDPPDGRRPALTEEGQRRVAARAAAQKGAPQDGWANGPEDRPLGERCILGRPAGPPLRPETYNNTVQIFQTSKHVALLNEMIHNARIIPLDGRPLTGIRQYPGESRGRFEGETLIIETTNFLPASAAFIAWGSSENLKLTERVRRIDANTLVYQFTIDDPTIWTRPWTAEFPLTRESGMYEFACHEGNYGLVGILSAARAEEKKAKTSEKR